MKHLKFKIFIVIIKGQENLRQTDARLNYINMMQIIVYR